MRAGIILAAALALAGCATDRVTLLENEPGRAVGAVAVLGADGDNDTVLDTANTQALLRRGTPRVRSVARIDPAYAALIDTLPPGPAEFLITFPVGEARIRDEQRAIIDQIQAEIARRPGAQVEVAGFTDSTGDAASNDVLSRERAEAVAQQLRDFGVAIDPEDSVGRGEYEAVAELGDDVADESYRRVAVIIR